MSKLRRLFLDRSGRISRKTYWLATSALAVVFSLPPEIARYISGADGQTPQPLWFAMLDVTASAATFWLTFAVTVKRMHDFGAPTWPAILLMLSCAIAIIVADLEPVDGWETYFLLPPFLSLSLLATPLAAFVYIGLRRGDAGPNLYGDPPP